MEVSQIATKQDVERLESLIIQLIAQNQVHRKKENTVYSVSEVALKLKVSTCTVRRYIKEGKLGVIQSDGKGKMCISAEHIDEYLKQYDIKSLCHEAF